MGVSAVSASDAQASGTPPGSPGASAAPIYAAQYKALDQMTARQRRLSNECMGERTQRRASLPTNMPTNMPTKLDPSDVVAAEP